jgi:guanylate kinase
MPTAYQPLVFIVSGPSGSGKSTLVEKLLELPGTMLSVSCTTRPPRATESKGKWYNFVSEAEFQGMVNRGEFLEYAQVFGKNWYGTPWKSLDESRSKALDLVLEIDVQGAQQVRQKLKDSIAIFIFPPSRQELERRIRNRGQDSEDEIARRLERARKEILASRDSYDYCVINDDLERAGYEVQAIAVAARRRTGRNEQVVLQILESFGG